MFFKSVLIGVVCFLAVLISVESLQCHDCITTSTNVTDPCYSGNGTTIPTAICPITATHCTRTTTTVGTITTTNRACTVGCIPSISTECCTTDFCNKAGASVPGFQCYGCTTTSNSTSDPCLAGNVTSSVMVPYTCPGQSKDCYMESTTVGAVTTFNRGCRIGTCNTGDCKSCSKNLCNTLKGDASFSAGSFSFTGFILLITVSLWKSF